MDRLWHLPALVLIAIGRITYKSVFFVIVSVVKLIIAFISLFKSSLSLLQSIKAPRLPQPKVSLPKLPKVSLPQWQMRRPKFTPRKPQLKPLHYLFLSIMATGTLLFYWFILKDLPRPTDLATRQPTLSTKIYDRNEQLLFTFYKDQNRTLMPLIDLPDHFVKATLAIEDSQFYQHKGISWKGILRSLSQIVFEKRLQGGSTITQQLIKTTLLTPERTITRKLKELLLAVEVELLYSKDEILQMYLNQVSYGGTAYGAEQAASARLTRVIDLPK